MTFIINSKASGLFITLAVVILLAATACPSACNTPPAPPEIFEATATPTPIWSGLLQRTPYPYTTPLPPARATILDGTYTKLDPRQSVGTPLPEGGVWMPHPRRKGVNWLKPLPYPLEGGVWTLQLDQGVFRVFHEATGWRTLGSFTVSGDQIEFFNDPHCIDAVGIYKWKLEAGQLALEVIEDECDGRVLGGGGLRATNFTSFPWMLDNLSSPSE
jgi:hypothetical protein